MNEVSQMMLPVPEYDVERVDRALATYTSLGHQAALSKMRSSRVSDFNPIEVSRNSLKKCTCADL